MNMDRLKMHSVNKVDENIRKIAELFPNTLTEVIKGYRDDGTPIIEHAIDFDVLRQELSNIIVEGPEERYQFTWPDKKKSILLANAPIAKTLRPCREESVDFDKTENLYIEGDNLDALKLLQETYLGKVKMIYIDPPYNTGNDFVYEDDFAQSTDEYLANSGQFDEDGNRLVQNTESNGRFHTDWLNMMYPRLKLAKDLLGDDGVIFISIDDNEVENLKKICNEVFGEKNFLVNCIWISGRTAAAHFTNSHEYIIGYAKNINMLPLFKYHGDDQLISDRTIKRPSAKNPISSIDFPAGIDFECEDKVFPSQFGDKEPVIVEKGIFECENKKLKYPVTLKAAWAMKDMIIKWLNGEEVYDQKGQRIKRFFFKSNGVLQYEKEKGTVHPNSVIDDITTKNGTNELVGLFEADVFTFPKPTKLVQYFSSVLSKEDIILDFFSGSATTAHAVMQLNAEDGGNRKFIMVQLPEPCDENSEAYKAGYKTIAEIGKERIRRAGRKILEEHPEAAGRLDTGFRVLKVDSTNMRDVYYNPAEYQQDQLALFADNFKPDRTPEDLLFQVMLDLGVLLSSKIEETIIGDKKVFSVADGYLMACFDSHVTSEVITEIAKREPYYAVFRDSSLASDSVATNFEQIFATYSPTTVRKVL
jgi:adenine-specific DNA-methyltransferase